MSRNQSVGISNDAGETKRKTMSSNLLNMKFMQRGRDLELAAQLKQQHAQEVSDQQWHLSIVRESNPFKQGSHKTAIQYEPSYSAFHHTASATATSQPQNAGRKTFGEFLPKVEELIREVEGKTQFTDQEVAERQSQVSSDESVVSAKPNRSPKRARDGKLQSEGFDKPKRQKRKERKQ